LSSFFFLFSPPPALLPLPLFLFISLLPCFSPPGQKLYETHKRTTKPRAERGEGEKEKRERDEREEKGGGKRVEKKKKETAEM
ncbi:hypothetical protein M8360_33490, partial [Klebsiella pneumoniae]|nr:hypothetical protein [Klebsiella pneumoniae]